MHPSLLITIIGHHNIRVEAFPKTAGPLVFMNHDGTQFHIHALTARPTVMQSFTFLKPLTSVVVVSVRSG